MTSPSSHEDHAAHSLKPARGRRRPIPTRRIAATLAALLGLALLVAGCGSDGPGVPGGSNTNSQSTASSGATLAMFLAYSRCMRSHGVHDFPDPTTSPGGGVGIQINRRPGSDLDPNNPTYKAANHACRALEPSRLRARTPPARKLAAEVKWARCMRAHGLPSFPDPNRQGTFNRNKIDENSPAFQTASNACKSLHSGPIPVSP
jgi:hypothetical protein